MFSPRCTRCEERQRWIDELGAVLREARRGNFEPRVLHVDEAGDLREPLTHLNGLLDVIDAFVRESAAALGGVVDDRFHRVVIERGLPGSFRRSAGIINASIESTAQQSRRLRQIGEERIRMADDFEASIKSVVDSVAATATQLSATAEALTARAESTNESARSMAETFEAARNNVVAIASAIEELSTSIANNQAQLEASNEEMRGAADCSKRSFETVNALADAGARIGNVVSLIRSIAGQTNLLALNATIEAASAGAAGRGFAVVASEVKSLAGQTGGATNDIAQQVDGIQAVTSDVVQLIGEIGGSIEKLEAVSREFANSMHEQGRAAIEISQSTQEVAASSERVSENVDSVTNDAAQATSSARELLEAANELSRIAEGVRGDVAAFLNVMRAQ